MLELLPNYIGMYNNDLMLVKYYSQLLHQIIHTKLQFNELRSLNKSRFTTLPKILSAIYISVAAVLKIE